MSITSVSELVEALRVEIGLAPDDESQDAWLEARLNGILAAIRRYCRRHLWPVASFRDVFMGEERCCYPITRPVAVLAETPVSEIDAITIDGAAADPADFEVSASGRLYRVVNGVPVPAFAFRNMVVDYDAGYVELPGDIYEAITGMIDQAWASSGLATTGVDPLLGAKKVSIVDVGSVEYESPNATYYESGVKASGHAILGPWTSVLAGYRDYVRGIGLPLERESTLIADPATP